MPDNGCATVDAQKLFTVVHVFPGDVPQLACSTVQAQYDSGATKLLQILLKVICFSEQILVKALTIAHQVFVAFLLLCSVCDFIALTGAYATTFDKTRGVNVFEIRNIFLEAAFYDGRFSLGVNHLDVELAHITRLGDVDKDVW